MPGHGLAVGVGGGGTIRSTMVFGKVTASSRYGQQVGAFRRRQCLDEFADQPARCAIRCRDRLSQLRMVIGAVCRDPPLQAADDLADAGDRCVPAP